jgi:hypothetical protein
MLEHPFLCRALIGDLGRAARLPELALRVHATFYEPIERLLAEGVADGSLRQVADPGTVAMSVFGAITIAGLSVAVEEAHNDPAESSVRLGAAISELILNGLGTRDGHVGGAA